MKDEISILEDKVLGDLSWRKKELSTYLQFYKEYGKGEVRKVLTRSYITMAYAHLEGGIKVMLKQYIEFLNAALKNNRSNMLRYIVSGELVFVLDLFILDKLNKLSQNKREKREEFLNHCLQFLCYDGNHKDLNIDELIKNSSNLNYKQIQKFYNIFNLCMNKELETESQFFNQLLNQRNSIAHGDKAFSEQDPEYYKEKVLKILDLIKGDIFHKMREVREILNKK